jgi:hypothetical protein
VDTATAIAIAAPNAVAATAIIVGWLQHGRGLNQAQRLIDLGEVRGVLDESAVLLHRMALVLDELRAEFGHGVTPADRFAEDLEHVAMQLSAAMELCGQTDMLAERLAVRLGRTHEAVVAMFEASSSARATRRSFSMLRYAPQGEMTAEIEARFKRVQGIATKAAVDDRATFDAARAQFVDAAQRAAGADLPVD